MTTNGKATNGHACGLTRRETRKIWDAYGRPDDAKALAQHLWSIGYPIPVGTLQRWIKRWQELAAKPSDKAPADPAPRTMEDAIEKLDAEIPTVTNDPYVRGRELLDRLSSDKRRAEIEGMEPSELTRHLARKGQETCIEVWESLRLQRDYLVRERPSDLGKLIKALGDAMEKCVQGYEKAIFLNERMSGIASDSAKVIEHDPQAPEPLAKALLAWGTA